MYFCHEILGVHQRVHAAFLERSTFGQHPHYHGVLYILLFGEDMGQKLKIFCWQYYHIYFRF